MSVIPLRPVQPIDDADLPRCRVCRAELLPRHIKFSRWWCTDPNCRMYHLEQYVRLLRRRVTMRDVYAHLGKRIKQAKETTT